MNGLTTGCCLKGVHFVTYMYMKGWYMAKKELLKNIKVYQVKYIVPYASISECIIPLTCLLSRYLEVLGI